jgi:ribosomal protein L11 methyltransferase
MDLADTLPDTSLDIFTDNEADPETYIFTWFIPNEAKMALAQALGQLLPNLSPEFETVEENIDYVALTRANFPPLSVGPFFIARNDEPTPAGQIGLAISPNRAFGSGEHATTMGCLLMYLKWAQNGLPANPKGLDYGAGSGILAIAAAKHAQLQGINFPFVCLDNDPPSVEINAENAQLNGVENLLSCAVAEVPPTGQTYSLVFANILMQPLLDLSEGLVACLAKSPNSGLILSGFTHDQGPAIAEAYIRLGLKRVAENEEKGWLAQLWQYV